MALYYIEWIDYVSLIVILFMIINDFFSTNFWNIKLRGRGGISRIPKAIAGSVDEYVYEMIFDCLFVCFSSHSIIFQSFGDITVAGEELQILTYARHS